MMFGRVDRSGAREGKKSLRKNKQAINKIKKEEQRKEDATHFIGKQPKNAVNPPPPLNSHTHELSLIDAGCGLVNRRLENEISRVIPRAQQAGVEAMIVLSNDFEKQEALLKLSKEYNGVVYFVPGVHPDNVKRTNDKLQQQRMEQLKELAVNPQCVAISCGLDFSREVSTHYAQEKQMKEQIDLAIELDIPVVFVQVAAVEQIMEALTAHPSLKKCAIYNFCGTETELNAYLSFPTSVHFMISGLICDPSDKGQVVKNLLTKIPKERILLISDSPFNTPQNIEDAWIRDQRNEPSNLPYVLQVAATALNTTPAEFTKLIRNNTKAFFELKDEEEVDLTQQPTPDVNNNNINKIIDGTAEDSEEESLTIVQDTLPVKTPTMKPTTGKPSPENNNKSKQTNIKNAKKGAKGAKSKDKEESDSDEKPKSKGQQLSAARKKHQQIVPQQEESEESEDEDELDEESEEEFSEEEESIEPIKYACKMCRNVLFSSVDILSHRNEDTYAAKTATKTRTQVEHDICLMFFIKDGSFLITKQADTKQESTEATTSSADVEGKLACPQCHAKIGRWSAVSPVPCSCGMTSSDLPCYVVKKKAIDLLLPLDAPRSASLAARLSEMNIEGRMEDSTIKKAKKKKTRKTKKNTANFSSFRNKTYG